MFVIGIKMRWISVKPRPIAIGAKPFGARSSVAPRMMIRKNAVRTISATSAETRLWPFGECSPYPLLAKPLTAASNPALPEAKDIAQQQLRSLR